MTLALMVSVRQREAERLVEHVGGWADGLVHHERSNTHLARRAWGAYTRVRDRGDMRMKGEEKEKDTVSELIAGLPACVRTPWRRGHC